MASWRQSHERRDRVSQKGEDRVPSEEMQGKGLW
jgi:hypothetical protein